MQTQTELIEHFNRTRETLRKLLLEIDTDMEIYPGWTIKEVLSHLSGWDDSTVQALQTFAAGQPPLMTAMRGILYHNEQTVAERKELTLEQVTREWEWVRGQLIPIIEQMTEKDLTARLIAPWGESLTVFEILNIMIEHEEEHAEIIKARIENPQEPPQAH
jgi:hypothetical protein